MMRMGMRVLVVGLVVAGGVFGGWPGVARANGGGGAGVGWGDEGDAAWATVRERFPVDQPVYRPTWLPERFGSPQFSDDPFGVVYRGVGEERLTFAVSLNTEGAPLRVPAGSVPYMVQGRPAYLTVPPIVPDRDFVRPFTFEIGWLEGYTFLQARLENTRQPGSAAGEVIHAVASLVPVGADGAFAAQCFAATGQCIGGRFLARWLASGGLALHGYPLTGEFRQTLEDGQEYRVQYFERVRLEWHPENRSFQEIELGQFGRRIFRERSGREVDPPAPQAGPHYFTEAGHNLTGSFLAYYQRYGGISQFGLPLTEPFPEQLADGGIYTVQYFERARFEYHPENAAPYDVLLGQFGRQILAAGR